MRAARARPSEAGSMPTMAAISMCLPWRRILIIKSVPILPLPIMAAFNLRVILHLGESSFVNVGARDACAARQLLIHIQQHLFGYLGSRLGQLAARQARRHNHADYRL